MKMDHLIYSLLRSNFANGRTLAITSCRSWSTPRPSQSPKAPPTYNKIFMCCLFGSMRIISRLVACLLRFFGLVLVRLYNSTSDKKLVRVDFVISVVVTCRKRVIKNLQNTDTKMHFTSTIGMMLISTPWVS